MEENKYKLIFFLIPIIIFILYLLNINDFFISDDFNYLFYSHFFTTWNNPWLDIHPFATFIFDVQYTIFRLNPQGYHLVNIGLHIFNSYLVYFIIRELTNNEKTSSIGGLMFSTFPIFSESIIWISAEFELWMTAFILLSFISYLKYSKQDKLIWLILSLIYFTFAILSKEIAAIFIMIYFSYDLIFDKDFENYLKESTELSIKIKKIGKYCIKYLFFIGIIIIYYIFFIFNKKISLHDTPYFKFASFISFIPNSFFPLFLGNSDLYLLLFFVCFFGLVAISYFVFKSDNKILKFCLIWILVIILGFAVFNLTSIDIYYYLMLIGINAIPQGRFLYIIGVGVVIFYASILKSFHNKKFNIKFKSPIPRNYIFYSLIIFLLVGNSLLIYSQQHSWKRATNITSNILLKTFVTVPIGTQNVSIYYINVPDHINSPFGPTWYSALVLRNGLEESIRLFYPNCMIFNFNMIYYKKILDFELSNWRIPIGVNEFNQISNESSNVILFFNPVTELLIDVSGRNYTEFDPYPFLGIPKIEYWFD